jgi:hypothetical protein
VRISSECITDPDVASPGEPQVPIGLDDTDFGKFVPDLRSGIVRGAVIYHDYFVVLVMELAQGRKAGGGIRVLVPVQYDNINFR